MSKDELKAVKPTIKEHLEKRWIQPSTSPYRAPVIVVHKKTGELHIAIDYQMFSNDNYLIPQNDKLLDRLGKSLCV